jgi:hypothetical protein
VAEDCNDGNGTVGPLRPAYFDADGDGAGEGDPVMFCYGSAPPFGFTATRDDCAPGDPTRWRLLSYAYRDADGDGFGIPDRGTVCSGDALPVGYLATAGLGIDCDDGDPAVHTAVTGFPDADGDGFGAAPGGTFCTAGELPAGYVANATDCAPEDPSRWHTVTNLLVDRDGDGFTAPATGTLCAGATLPEPYRATAHGNDCDDGDPTLWRWVVLYPDRDGDGVGAPPRQIQCLGESFPAGLSTAGWDVDDANPAVQWGAADAELVQSLW